MEQMCDDDKVFNSGDDDEQESEDLIYFSDEDDEFDSEEEITKSEDVNQDHQQWAFGMLDYFINKWKEKSLGNPPSNWKDILIKLLDLEQYVSVDPTKDFERFSEDFIQDYDKQKFVPLSTRGGWFPNVKPIGLKGGIWQYNTKRSTPFKTI